MNKNIGDLTTVKVDMNKFQRSGFTPQSNNPSSISRDFSWALELLKGGKCITRTKWEMKRIIVVSYTPFKNDEEITYKKSLQVIDEDGNQMAWVPTDADLFANDYILMNDNDSSSNWSGSLIRSMISKGNGII